VKSEPVVTVELSLKPSSNPESNLESKNMIWMMMKMKKSRRKMII